MANFAKSMKKSAQKFSSELFSDKGLTLSQVFKSTTSLYKGKNESKPLISVSARGDCRISVLKLVIILLCSVSCTIFAALLIRSIIDRCRAKKHQEADISFDETYVDENEIPF